MKIVESQKKKILEKMSTSVPLLTLNNSPTTSTMIRSLVKCRTDLLQEKIEAKSLVFKQVARQLSSNAKQRLRRYLAELEQPSSSSSFTTSNGSSSL